MDSPFSKDSSLMSEKVRVWLVLSAGSSLTEVRFISMLSFLTPSTKNSNSDAVSEVTFAGSSGSSKRIEKVLPSELSLISVTSGTAPVSITCEESLEMICVKSSRLLPAASWMALSEL